MKKTLALVLTLCLLLTAVILPAAAEESFPQPEGGKKFESFWAVPEMTVQIDYEEAGYRVQVDKTDTEHSTVDRWSYNCVYDEKADALVALTAEWVSFVVDASGAEISHGEPAYEYQFDIPEGKDITFSLNEEGKLIWKDGIDDFGKGLAFTNVGGFFAGEWIQAEGEEPVKASIAWNGLSENEMYYTIYVTRGSETADTYVLYVCNGFYDPATGKLGSAYATSTVFTKNAEGGYDATESAETTEIFFSFNEKGELIFEGANGIVMEQNFISAS